MPERLDTVTIQLRRRPVTVTWEESEQLLAVISADTEVGQDIRGRFAAAGASHPVALTSDHVVYLLALLEGLTFQEETGIADMPEGLARLRDALADDLHDDPRG